MAIHRSRVSPYFFLLFVAFAVVGLVGFQTLRERRFFKEIIKDKDAEIENLQEELQKEKQSLEDMHERLEQLHIRANMLRTDKEKLKEQLTDMETKKHFIEETQQRLQSVLRGKENQIMTLKEQENKVNDKETEIANLNALLEKKENMIKEMKARLAEFEERKNEAQGHLVGESNNVRTPEPGNTPSHLDSKEQTNGLTGEKVNFESKEETSNDEGINKLEMVEKEVLEGNVESGTLGDIDGLQDRQLEESTELQRNGTGRSDGPEDENEDINDNLDNLKDLENLEVDIDGKDRDDDDDEVEETGRTANDEETEVDADVIDRNVGLDDSTLNDTDKVAMK